MFPSEPSSSRRFQQPTQFSCTECGRSFHIRSDYILHSELCLLEAFENEALTVLSDMPSLRPSNSQAPLPGIVAKASDTAPRLQRVDLQVVPKTEKKREGEQRPQRAVFEKQQHPGESRTIEGPGGLKLVVSVEKGTDIPPLSIEASTSGEAFEEEDGDSVQSMALDDNFGVYDVYGGGRGVIGALANADDDTYKPKMECPTCGLILYRHNFSTHYRIHTGELPFACDYCEKRFRTTSALKVHTRAHTGEKPYKCMECSYSSITKRNLDRHIVNNHIRPGERKGLVFRYRESPEDEWPALVEGGTEVVGDDHEYDGPRQQLSQLNQFLDEDALLKTNILQEERQPA